MFGNITNYISPSSNMNDTDGNYRMRVSRNPKIIPIKKATYVK